MIDYIDGGNLFRNLKFLFPFFWLSFFNCTHLKSFLSLFLLSHRLFLGSTFLSFTARSLAVPHLNLLSQLSSVLMLISSILFALCFSPSLSYSLSLLLSVSLILSHCFYLYLSHACTHTLTHFFFVFLFHPLGEIIGLLARAKKLLNSIRSGKGSGSGSGSGGRDVKASLKRFVRYVRSSYQ